MHFYVPSLQSLLWWCYIYSRNILISFLRTISYIKIMWKHSVPSRHFIPLNSICPEPVFTKLTIYIYIYIYIYIEPCFGIGHNLSLICLMTSEDIKHQLIIIIISTRMGAGIAQWLEHRTRDWKVAGSNPCWNGGRIFFSRVDFLCWLLFRYPFHPRVTTVARKKSRSFCQKCRWQVTAKHAYTLRMWILLNRASALVTTCP